MKRHLASGILALGLFLAATGATAHVARAEPYQQDINQGMKDSQQGMKDAGQRLDDAHRAVESTNKNSNWGWLGLIGLAGLAGLARRPQADLDERTRQRTGYRAGEPLGSR
jgi:MYXO-CTERM domain-containing protein